LGEGYPTGRPGGQSWRAALTGRSVTRRRNMRGAATIWYLIKKLAEMRYFTVLSNSLPGSYHTRIRYLRFDDLGGRSPSGDGPEKPRKVPNTSEFRS
jgi:hypothetical protein